jgi:trehalose/maltose hydrolase-like predicted phosphorylase
VATALDRTFEAIVLDWDSTAVPDRQAGASGVRARVEALCGAGVHVFVVSDADVATVDGRLQARPHGRGRLHLCCSRGSEGFAVTADGPRCVFRRTASPTEESALIRATERTVGRLRARGAEVKAVSERLNCRAIELAPGPARLTSTKVEDVDPLTEAGLAGVVALAADASRDAGLVDPRITCDMKQVTIGLTDKSDSARWAANWLVGRGITGGLILIVGNGFGPVGGLAGVDSLVPVDALTRAVVVSVGDEEGGEAEGVVQAGGGSRRFLELLDGQRARRAARRVPDIDLDPAWVVRLPSTRANERIAGALGTLANGFIGLRDSGGEEGHGLGSLFLVSGVYARDNQLLSGPLWTGLEQPGIHRRHSRETLLDLRTGMLERSGNGPAKARFVRFVSMASPHAMALRAEAPEPHLDPGDPLRPPLEDVDFERDMHGRMSGAKTKKLGAEIAMAAEDHVETRGGLRTIERLATWSADPTGTADLDDAYRRLAEAEALGFDGMLAEHREAWAQRWAGAEVVIEGDPEGELAARFAVFHLLAAAADSGEAAVGARGLTGNGYAGHVFWDADVFVLPVLAAIRPAAARAMLEYRIRRLPEARAAAHRQGRRGARFPWESAGDGSDVTPRLVRGGDGELVPIATGPHEEHIVADVAWAADHYASWTGDAAFLIGPGRALVVDTARYWASRIRIDARGNGHIEGTMGPDEYHQIVDDDAYTNVMARWNLRRASDLLVQAGETDEAETWRGIAEGLVDGWDPDRAVYEQFAGYFGLEPLLMSDVAHPPVAADVLLGSERVAGSQLIKQADVLMLHHLVPDEVVDGSLESCLAFYEPRTAHGSSLSPAIHASLLARAGQPERALDLFRMATRLDLDDLTGTTAGGLHLATMGGVWQALAFGFLGLAAEGSTLAIRPNLPKAWSALGLTFHFAGQLISVRAEDDQVTINAVAPILVRVADQAPVWCDSTTSIALEPSFAAPSHK